MYRMSFCTLGLGLALVLPLEAVAAENNHSWWRPLRPVAASACDTPRGECYGRLVSPITHPLVQSACGKDCFRLPVFRPARQQR